MNLCECVDELERVLWEVMVWRLRNTDSAVLDEPYFSRRFGKLEDGYEENTC